MYRFDSINDFKEAFDKAYVEGMEKEENGIEVFSDFDGIALLALREAIAYMEGELEGMMSASGAYFISEETSARMKMLASMIDVRAEVMTKKMEELGLL